MDIYRAVRLQLMVWGTFNVHFITTCICFLDVTCVLLFLKPFFLVMAPQPYPFSYFLR